jgi:hypothetical protein
MSEHDFVIWMPLLSTLVGAVAALIAGTATTWWNDRRRDIRERKQVAAALAGELRGFKTLFDVYQVEAELVRLKSQTVSRTSEMVQSIPLRGNYFQVFETNAQHIGLLPTELADSVAVTYVLLRAILEESKRLEEFNRNGETRRAEYYEKFYDHLISLVQQARERTESLIPRLRQYSESGKDQQPPRLANGQQINLNDLR